MKHIMHIGKWYLSQGDDYMIKAHLSLDHDSFVRSDYLRYVLSETVELVDPPKDLMAFHSIFGSIYIYEAPSIIDKLFVDVDTSMYGVSTHTIEFECAHTYKHYQGLTESYNYCTKCDHKESEND